MTHAPLPVVQTTATWDRAVVNATRDEVSLVIRLVSHDVGREVVRGVQPADVVFVIDRSGSMAGERLALVREATMRAAVLLSPDHRAAVVAFDHDVQVVLPLTPMTSEGRRRLQQAVEKIDSGGSTDLSTGWLTGCDLLAQDDQFRPKRVVLLTDGHANAGITDPGMLAHHASELQRRGIVTSTMGVGLGFDELLLTGMAEAGGGNFRFLDRPEDFVAAFGEEVENLTEVVATRPVLEVTLPPGYRAQLLNRFPVERVGKTLTISLRDLANGEEIALVLAVTHHGRMAQVAQVRATLHYQEAGSGRRQDIALDIPVLRVGSAAEVMAAPVDNEAILLRAREQAQVEQREALRLDRAGRHVESRAMFAASRTAITDAQDRVARTGRAIRMPLHQEMQAALTKAEELAAAAPVPLSEQVHKERAAHHSRTSRGGRQS